MPAKKSKRKALLARRARPSRAIAVLIIGAIVALGGYIIYERSRAYHPPSTAEEALADSNYMITPAGLYPKSCVTEGDANITCSLPSFQTSSRTSPLLKGKSGSSDGWIETAYWYPAGKVYHMSTSWRVPPKPKNHGNQLDYFFPGSDTTDASPIIQPVLQWGKNGNIGTKDTYTISSWKCGDTCEHSNPITVAPGDLITGRIDAYDCDSGTAVCKWDIYTKDVTTGKSTDHKTSGTKLQPMVIAWGGVLETYRVGSKDDLPAGPITFTSISVLDRNKKPYSCNTCWGKQNNTNLPGDANYAVTTTNTSVKLSY